MYYLRVRRHRLVAPVHAHAALVPASPFHSDEAAQAMLEPAGPRPMPVDVEIEDAAPPRPATLKSPGAPEKQAVDLHNLLHFPSEPWCEHCVQSRGHDAPHMERDNIDAVTPTIQRDYGFMGDGSEDQASGLRPLFLGGDRP